MMTDELKNAGLNDDVRRELMEYYKWIVSLALFVLTVSLTLAGLFPKGLHYSSLLTLGWGLLGSCVFLNWLIIKRLIIIPIVSITQEKDRGPIHTIFIRSMQNLQLYALLQNWFFLLGTFAIGVGFILNFFVNR